MDQHLNAVVDLDWDASNGESAPDHGRPCR